MSQHDARMLWREELALAGATASEIITFDGLSDPELAQLIYLAIRIGKEWGDQDGISGTQMDRLAYVARMPSKRLDEKLAEVVARTRRGES